MYSRKSLFSLVFLSALALLSTACNRNAEAGAQGRDMPAMAVKMQLVEPQKVGQFTEYLTTLRSRGSTVIQPQVDGNVEKLLVSPGQRVSAGTPLIQIDAGKQEAAVNNQEANREARLAALALAERQFTRAKELAEAGVISKSQLDQAKTAYDSAKAEVEATQASVQEQRVQLRYYTIKAPTAGIVGEIPVRVGDRVTPDTILTTVDIGGELEAYISIPADKSGQVRVGTPVEIIIDPTQPGVRAKIVFVSPRVDPELQTLLVKAEIPNDNRFFRNEQVARARVFWSEEEVPTVPVTAVTRLGGQFFIFVAGDRDGKLVAQQRPIQVGEVVGNNYVVREGVTAGERVITSGTQLLQDGAPVQEAPAAPAQAQGQPQGK
jgi:RND family efflux transporter MFP subunit